MRVADLPIRAGALCLCNSARSVVPYPRLALLRTTVTNVVLGRETSYTAVAVHWLPRHTLSLIGGATPTNVMLIPTRFAALPTMVAWNVVRSAVQQSPVRGVGFKVFWRLRKSTKEHTPRRVNIYSVKWDGKESASGKPPPSVVRYINSAYLTFQQVRYISGYIWSIAPGGEAYPGITCFFSAV